MQLELNDLRKTYLLPAPLLHRRGQGKPKTKQALAGGGAMVRPPRARHCVPPHSWLYAAAAGTVRQLYWAALSCLHGCLKRNS